LCCDDVDQEHILINRRLAKTLAKQNELIKEELTGSVVTGEVSESKKVFVEPTISVPVDVLEATTFFQAATSGATN
jgi:hypothetical protein